MEVMNDVRIEDSAWFGKVTLGKDCLELPLSSSKLLHFLLPSLLLHEFEKQADYFRIRLVYEFSVDTVSN